jgi:hypothetical protein
MKELFSFYSYNISGAGYFYPVLLTDHCMLLLPMPDAPGKPVLCVRNRLFRVHRYRQSEQRLLPGCAAFHPARSTGSGSGSEQ